MYLTSNSQGTKATVSKVVDDFMSLFPNIPLEFTELNNLANK
jgi:hypothetical protein